jgi:alkanesulfonate monooxygenase SsuD/methylene tetrahydromethanopterin reductase-like flavin-dependent oxidoreductase (luciferase family)
MCPKTYLIKQALPALNRGAESANRDKRIPLIAHVPIAVSSDRSVARHLAQEQLARYSEIPFYQAMFQEAGFEIAGNPYPDELLDDLVISGTEDEVAEKLVSYISEGCGEVLAAPLINDADRASSITESFSAIALANKQSVKL